VGSRNRGDVVIVVEADDSSARRGILARSSPAKATSPITALLSRSVMSTSWMQIG
jgi:hypothetical protein